MPNDNAESEVLGTKKPRHKKSLQELILEQNKLQKRIALENAQSALHTIPNIKELQSNMKRHDKFIMEGKELLDSDKFAARKAALMLRLKNLDGKREIATLDVARRESAKTAFDSAIEAIGNAISTAAETNQTVTSEGLNKIFNSKVTPEQQTFLKDSSDVYAPFRRKKNVVVDAPAMPSSDESSED